MIHVLSDTDAETDPDLTFDSLRDVIDLTKDEDMARQLQNFYDSQDMDRRKLEENDFRLASSLHDDDIQITGFTLPKSSPFTSTKATSWKELKNKFDRMPKKAKLNSQGISGGYSSPALGGKRIDFETPQSQAHTSDMLLDSSKIQSSSRGAQRFTESNNITPNGSAIDLGVGSSKDSSTQLLGKNGSGYVESVNSNSAKSKKESYEYLLKSFDDFSQFTQEYKKTHDMNGSCGKDKEVTKPVFSMNGNNPDLSDSTESDVSLIMSQLKRKNHSGEFLKQNENLGVKTQVPKNSVPLKSSSMININPTNVSFPMSLPHGMDRGFILSEAARQVDRLIAQGVFPEHYPKHGKLPEHLSKHGDIIPKLPEEGIYERPMSSVEQKEALKNLLSNAVGADNITPKDQRLKTPSGLNITLLEHQKLGLEWMLKMEGGSNKGGILADDMGLGKTIQSISIILQNPSSDRKLRPTLIIAPTSLILQWKKEILERVVGDKLRIALYYGANRIKDPRAFNNYDIILTSYGTVAGEWPKEPKKKKEKQVFPLPGSDSDSGEDRVLRHMAGPLFRASFYRIILDEAHSIKNKGTRSSKAVSELDSQFRWCLTGTPIQNGISELYSLLRFLRIRPYNDWTEWRTRIEEPFKRGRQKLALRRIQTVMTAICLRRRKTDSLDGLPLIQLPERNVKFETLTFSKPEKEFYDALEKRIQLKFNSYVEAGTVMKNYTNILLLLLRLRQAACHPNLVSKDFEKSSLGNADESMALVKTMDRNIADRLVGTPDLESQECPICFDTVQNGMIIQKCGHIFCYECINSHISTLPNQTCPSCRGALDYSNLIPIMSFYSVFAPHKYKEKEMEIKSGSKEWKSSTKIDNLVRILKETKVNHPKEKTIVFSQFVSFLDLIEVPLKEQGLHFVRFDGSMNARERDRAVETFRTDSRINILLISLKCGSLGLNLTCANRVCLMDLWWNPAIENQAIDRVHRFGQKKTVEVCRMTVEGTVEDRILALQEKKQQVADAILDEGGRQSSSRLGLNDLMTLFNVDRELEDD